MIFTTGKLIFDENSLDNLNNTEYYITCNIITSFILNMLNEK